MAISFIWKLLEGEGSTLWAICSSSPFLARKMVTLEDIKGAEVIVELWAGDGAFTKRLCRLAQKLWKNPEKIFIIEIDPHLCEELIRNTPPEFRESIYCIDVQALPELLRLKNISSIDLVISGLPFVNLPRELFVFVMTKIFWDFAHADTIFKQFTYISPDKNDIATNVSKYSKYAEQIVSIEMCFLNIPPAFVLTCKWFEKKVWHVVKSDVRTFHEVVTDIWVRFDEVKSKIKPSLKSS